MISRLKHRNWSLAFILVLLFSHSSFATLTLLESKVGTGVNNVAISNSGSLAILSISTTSLSFTEANNQGLAVLSLLNETSGGTTVPLSISEVLPYPNPMRISTGGHLYFNLNQNITLQCMVFDMFGRKIIDTAFLAGTQGGKFGINKVPINKAFFNNYPISSGVYFVIILENGSVLKKTKIAIVP